MLGNLLGKRHRCGRVIIPRDEGPRQFVAGLLGECGGALAPARALDHRAIRLLGLFEPAGSPCLFAEFEGRIGRVGRLGKPF